jgi:hypothetical protein
VSDAITGPVRSQDELVGETVDDLGPDEEICAVARGPDGARLVGTSRRLLFLHHDGMGGIVRESWSFAEVEEVSVVGRMVVVALRSSGDPVTFPLDAAAEESDLQAVTVINLQRAQWARTSIP